MAKDWSYLVGQKIGYLKVVELLPPGAIIVRPGRKSTVARCICKCGRECYKEVSNLARRMGVTCGSKECKHQIMSDAQALRRQIHPLNFKHVERQAAEPFPKSNVPVITQQLKMHYECIHPDPGCVRSEVCHVCCWECDKECKKCSNHPELCGARRRK